ncbi:MAG: arsenate reductase ArsC [Verrucomicrobiota bacterium]|jgi:arsenate reductase
MKKKVLFVCVHNSARSQMAEAFLNQMCGEDFEAFSAGLEPGRLNPVVVEVMREIGIDISRNKTKAVFDMFKAGKMFSHVITVCDEASAERCPVFAGVTTRLHWSFADPSSFKGAPEQVLQQTREVRDAIQEKIEQWCAEMCGRPCMETAR